jgi:hypothetical protein
MLSASAIPILLSAQKPAIAKTAALLDFPAAVQDAFAMTTFFILGALVRAPLCEIAMRDCTTDFHVLMCSFSCVRIFWMLTGAHIPPKTRCLNFYVSCTGRTTVITIEQEQITSQSPLEIHFRVTTFRHPVLNGQSACRYQE